MDQDDPFETRSRSGMAVDDDIKRRAGTATLGRNGSRKNGDRLRRLRANSPAVNSNGVRETTDELRKVKLRRAQGGCLGTESR